MVRPFRPSWAVLAGAVLVAPLGAQRNDRFSPTTYAITNARLVPVNGPVIEKGTLVIRDGLIAAMGATTTAPADARVIDGTGLTVYPGLIDGYGSLGMRAAAPAGQGAGQQAAAATTPIAPNSTSPVGVRPEVAAVNELAPDEATFAAPHAAGFTTALTAVGAGVFRGTSAVINLRGENVSAMILRPAVAQHVGFSRGGGGGGYPGSLFAVFSAIRQELLDAQLYRDRKAAYEKSSRGAVRPAWDPSLEALQPVLAGRMPVVLFANTQREIERALDLAKEFGLRPVIAGGTEAWKVADRLKAENVPVLLSISFPRRTTAPAADAEPELLSTLRARVDAPKGPGILQKAGVKVVLASGANYADYLANARRAVAAGMPAAEALRAMTVVPAELFGIADKVGTLEVGKVANLTVASGDLLEQGTRVTQLFVDGAPVTVTAAQTPAAPAGGQQGGRRGPGDLTGTWEATLAWEGTAHPVTFHLRRDGTRVTGVMEGTFGSTDLVGGTIDADGVFTFSGTLMHHDGPEAATFTGRIADGVLRGELKVAGHEATRFTATEAR